MVAAMQTLCATGNVTSGAADRLVLRTDFEVPERWAPPEIMGRNYRPMLAPGMWACPGKFNDERARQLGQGLLPRPDWPLFRDCALDVKGQNIVTPRILARMTFPATWRMGSGDRNHKVGRPYEIAEFFSDLLVSQFIDNPKSYVPIFATLTNARPSFFLDEKYDEDVAGFCDWKARNPNFLGFIVQGELESDIRHYVAGLDKCTNEAVRARMLREFPPPRNPRELIDAGLARYVEYGVSPRGAIALMKVAQAIALMEGRAYVTPDDVKRLRYAALRHRIILNFEASADEVHPEAIIDAIFSKIQTP